MGRSISIIGTKITLKGLTYIPQVDGKMIVLDMATPTKRSGYIRTDTEKWATNETARFIFVPVLGLRGTTLKIDAKSGQNLRIAFLKKPYFSNGSTPDFCQGTSLITRDAPVESFTEVIPSDCAYLYVFTTDIYGVDVTPTINDIIIPATYIITISGDEIINNGQTWQVEMGDSFVLEEIEANAGYGINLVTIIMGNTDITQEAYQDGVISIDRVTGNVVINVETASVTDTNMFTKRTTGNGISILNNKALLKGIRGNTMVWQNRGNLVRSNIYPVDITISSQTSEQIVFTPSAVNSRFSDMNAGVSNHVMLIHCKVYVDTDGTVSPQFGIGLVSNANNPSGAAPRTVHSANKWVDLTVRCPASGAQSGSTTDNRGGNNFMFCIGNSNSWMSSGTYRTVTIKEWFCVDLTYLFGAGNEPTIAEFTKLFPYQYYAYNSSSILLNNAMTNYISKDGNEVTLQNVSLNVPTLTGKLDGEGESVVVFPNGMKSSCNEAVNDTYDEIKQVDGVWKAIKRIGTERATSAISGRYEYEILAQEEVYILDDQTIPTEITVADQGVEEILPINEATPTTAPAIMEMKYGAIPSRGLLGGLLGGTKGGGSDEPDYSDGEAITDYEEEQEPNVEEPLEEPLDEEPKEDIKESPVIDEKQELKK